jgi:hypothetical protein
MINVLRTHPAAIIGGILQENPFLMSAPELQRVKQAPSV